MFFYFDIVYVFNVELRLGINFFLYSFMMKLDLFMVVFLVSMILYIFFGFWEVLEELMDWKENWNVMWCLWFWIYEILVFDRKYGFKFYLFEKVGGLILKGGSFDFDGIWIYFLVCCYLMKMIVFVFVRFEIGMRRFDVWCI